VSRVAFSKKGAEMKWEGDEYEWENQQEDMEKDKKKNFFVWFLSVFLSILHKTFFRFYVSFFRCDPFYKDYS